MRLFLSFAWVTMFGLTGCAMAQQPPEADSPATQPSMPPTEEPATPVALATPTIVDDALDKLDQLEQGLRDFTADVNLTQIDNIIGDSYTRAGTIDYLAKGDGDSAIRVTFDTRQVEGAEPRPDKVEYALNNGWLIERDYRRKKEINRQVRRPDEKMNLLKLGEGPFPLPIGQDKEEVHRLFEVSHVEPAADEPANTVHLRLAPRPGTQFERKFQVMDVWVDPQSNMPRRIDTHTDETTQRTELSNIQINTGLNETNLVLPKIGDDWSRQDEPFQE